MNYFQELFNLQYHNCIELITEVKLVRNESILTFYQQLL
ncbi:hypothetical protein GGR22_002914 [Flavobacterium gossypii]|uniref:Uncharacterized protein n=1 Tax=Flavobacterium gossypii TaxID=1646119 RepID=A0ABR6DSS7_9FLAO|nr:hypothetical protein [Flavobacterium gossypii]